MLRCAVDVQRVSRVFCLTSPERKTLVESIQQDQHNAVRQALRRATVLAQRDHFDLAFDFVMTTQGYHEEEDELTQLRHFYHARLEEKVNGFDAGGALSAFWLLPRNLVCVSTSIFLLDNERVLALLFAKSSLDDGYLDKTGTAIPAGYQQSVRQFREYCAITASLSQE